MSFRAALKVEEDEAEIMKRNGDETGWCPAEEETAHVTVSDPFGFFRVPGFRISNSRQNTGSHAHLS